MVDVLYAESYVQVTPSESEIKVDRARNKCQNQGRVLRPDSHVIAKMKKKQKAKTKKKKEYFFFLILSCDFEK